MDIAKIEADSCSAIYNFTESRRRIKQLYEEVKQRMREDITEEERKALYVVLTDLTEQIVEHNIR